jgi:HK97 gp10 family phage protein
MTVEWNGDQLAARIRGAAMRGVVRGTEAVLSEAVRLVQAGPKSGRIYRRRGITHRASAPGESPATDTGRLVQSGRTTYDAAELVGVVSFSTDYAEKLELGTERMEPRPFLRPALASQTQNIEDAVADEIRGVMG